MRAVNAAGASASGSMPSGSNSVQITFDIIFPDAQSYHRVLESQAITRDSIASLFRIPQSRIADFVTFAPANAIKFTLYRLRPSGSPGDWDILGCQQYGPLLEIEIPD